MVTFYIQRAFQRHLTRPNQVKTKKLWPRQVGQRKLCRDRKTMSQQKNYVAIEKTVSQHSFSSIYVAVEKTVSRHSFSSFFFLLKKKLCRDRKTISRHKKTASRQKYWKKPKKKRPKMDVLAYFQVHFTLGL